MSVATIIKTVGTSSRNFSTAQSWEDAKPADLTTSEKWNAGTFTGTFTQGETVTGTGLTAGKFLDSDGSSYVTFAIVTGNSATLVTLTGSTSGATCIVSTKTDTGVIWQGNFYNDSEFTGNAPVLSISGSTTSATCGVVVTCASGQSFKDNANKLTNALIYNVSNGVGLRNTNANAPIITINDNYVSLTGIQAGTTSGSISINWNGTNGTANNCIFQAVANSTGSGVLNDSGGTKFVNCLIYNTNTTSGCGIVASSSSTELRNCTFVSNTGTSWGIRGNYTTPLAYNCVSMNFTGNGDFRSGLSTSSNYNCSSDATAPGANSIKSKTYANQFVATGSDYRLKAGNDLGVGTRDQTNTNDLDIVGQARSTTSPSIGCWEYISSAVFIATKNTFVRQAINRSNTY